MTVRNTMSGFGKTPWGSGPWGGSDQEIQVGTFIAPTYQPPSGVPFGRVHISRFSGEPTSGPLAGLSGAIFFSPSLFKQNSTNEIDLASISFTVTAGDQYTRPSEREFNVFRFSGNSGWTDPGLSRTNDSLRKTQPKEYSVVATLVQTTPPGPTTFVRIP